MGIVTNTLQLINNIKLPTGNYGYLRKQMPQIKSDQLGALKKWLTEQQVGWSMGLCRVNKLKLAQSEANKVKIFKMMNTLRKSSMRTPILVSNDSPHRFVVDGSHRFLAFLNMEEKKYDKINCIMIDLPIQECIALLNTFPGVKHRNISDSKIDI